MALFQKSVLNKYLKLQDATLIDKAYKKFCKYFHNPKIQQNILVSKEEQFQQKFLIELFEKVFEYTIFPDEKYNITTEFKNLRGAKKADGAILVDGKALCVIELKGTNTKDLESIRQQAFDYKSNHPTCKYIITSNFEKIRFYIETSDELEEFNLFTLTKKEFELLYLCIHKDNLLNNIPLAIKKDSIVVEESITKKFYTDYSLFKRELFRDLVKQNLKNAVFRTELQKEDTDTAKKKIKLSLFKKSQKLIDRFLFIFFAEDRGLLPPNSTIKILKDWNQLAELDAAVPLYNRFKLYFKYLDQGRAGTNKKAEIFAYNGGLFKPDPILDSLILDDALLYKHTKALSEYDFESQVDVNILGHIFENSLNEIESVNAEIEGTDFDKQKTKRKKDGVFYTPKYITKYIVDNTIGKLCDEKKAEFTVIEKEYKPNRNKDTKIRLLANLESYRTWLLQITICDPACGSGAFLNQALDFLIKEHTYIDELQTKLLGGGFVFPNIENTVLENNIFGVDLNEESVEIAKLSLWLRTAQPRRKLNNLNSNIKCGNSLIDSKAVAGDKAFHWETEFKQVFEKGGFDVIIGNPPYVQLQKMKNISLAIAKLGYKTYESTGDLYCLFYEKGNEILKEKGVLGFITSNKWMRANYGKSLRNYLLNETAPYQLIDLGSGIFESAVVDSNIILFKKNKVKNHSIPSIDLAKEHFMFDFILDKNKFIRILPIGNEIWNISSLNEQKIKAKIEEKGLPLKEWNVKMYRGLTTGYNEAFLIESKLKNYFLNEYPELKDIIKPAIKGKEIHRYFLSECENYILNIHNGFNNTKRIEIDKYPKIKEHLDKYYNSLEKRYDKGSTVYNLRNCAYIDDFSKEKIIFSKASKIQAFSYDTSGSINLNTSYFLIGENLKYLLTILNSKLANYSFLKFYQSGGIQGEITIQAIEKIPIVKASKMIEEEFELKANNILKISENYYGSKNNFQTYIKQSFQLEKLSKKLQNWYTLEFSDFIKEINKAIKSNKQEKLTKLQEMDWMEVFEVKKAEAQTIKTQIDQTDAVIDAMVYELYGLTDDEILIVENS
tara:strand:- start:41213 stop:44401 length:3189 start_codon:yes stop_codon:yes gene_type:complete